MQIITRRAAGLAGFAMIPAMLLASVPSPQQVAIQKEGIQLIRQVEESARSIRSHAAHLDSLSKNMGMSQQIHHGYLERIKSSVNDELRPALERLSAIRPELPQWKQLGIQQMMDDAALLATHANDAIREAKDGGPAPHAMNVEYKDLVSRVYTQADSLVKTSDAVRDYSSARLKAYDAGVEVPQL
jgi:hypothetical protein